MLANTILFVCVAAVFYAFYRMVTELFKMDQQLEFNATKARRHIDKLLHNYGDYDHDPSD